jgi:hypothetical protein
MTICGVIQRAYILKYGNILLELMRKETSLDDIRKHFRELGVSEDSFYKLLYTCSCIMEEEFDRESIL